MRIEEITTLVVNHWEWTPKFYPILRKLPEETHGAFKRWHVLEHMMKELGKLVVAQEFDDHGNATFLNDRSYLVEHLAKMLASVLQLAHGMGVTPKELEQYIRHFYDAPDAETR